MTHTEDAGHRIGTTFTDALDATADAVVARDFAKAATQAGLLCERAEHLSTSVVRDALAAGTDWWTLGEHLGVHPQAAYEQYRGAREGLPSPAEQRPELAVLLTAGVAAEHDWDDAYGIDLDDLSEDHSLHRDPTVLRLRQAAALLREDVWIAVNIPGDYEGEARPRRARSRSSGPPWPSGRRSWCGCARPWPSTPTTTSTTSPTRI